MMLHKETTMLAELIRSVSWQYLGSHSLHNLLFLRVFIIIIEKVPSVKSVNKFLF